MRVNLHSNPVNYNSNNNKNNNKNQIQFGVKLSPEIEEFVEKNGEYIKKNIDPALVKKLLEKIPTKVDDGVILEFDVIKTKDYFDTVKTILSLTKKGPYITERKELIKVESSEQFFNSVNNFFEVISEISIKDLRSKTTELINLVKPEIKKFNATEATKKRKVAADARKQAKNVKRNSKLIENYFNKNK